MSISRRRLKTGSIGVAMAIGLSMALPQKVEAQDRGALFQNDWNVAVEQDKLAIQKGCIDPEQRQFLIDYTEMAAEGLSFRVTGGELGSARLIEQLQALPPCPDSSGFPTYQLGTGYSPPMILGGQDSNLDDEWKRRVSAYELVDYGETYNIFTGQFEYHLFEYDPEDDDKRFNPITQQFQHWCYDCWEWENDTPLVELPSFYYQRSAYNNDNTPNDSATLNERSSPAPGTAWNFLNSPLNGLRQSFHTVREYFTTPNDSSSLGGILKDSKTQEAIQDPKIVPAKGDVIAPGLKPAATTNELEFKRTLLKDATTPTNAAMPGDRGLTGTGTPSTSPGSDQVPGRSKNEFKENLRQQEVTNTPNAGKSSATGGKAMEDSTGLKNSSFNNKNSLEEKSFKNSVGEKSSGSKFTGEKVFSQQGSKSFAPMVGKTHTFSGMGTKSPTSGKSFKMHGF